MPKGILAVHTTPAPGREQEYNDWYNEVHLVDILKLAGFTSARRFRSLSGDGHPYLAIYEVEADDLQAAQDSLGKAVAAGEIRMSDVLAMDPPPVLTLYEQIAELRS
ncbi:MAG TPA: hypothetical protein VKV36_05400 [Acidimicrobiales bacterium]|nr:hypothetical protein [Acidimicrobiales bacterium]